jgi:2-methylaconitate cis-trans-isomerase PrpF
VSQIRLKAAFYRGGTSKAVIFRSDNLPTAYAEGGAARDALFLAIMGSPDRYGRQLDGMGGGISSLSKLAVVGKSSHPDADVDYTFAQVGIDKPVVGYRGNCGNIGSAIGPYAVDEGLVTAKDGTAEIRIHNTNTRKIMIAEFAVENGCARIAGDFVLDGVPGAGAPIKLRFVDPGGAATGKLFPTGNVVDVLKLPDGREIQATLIDAANPLVIVGMADLLPDHQGFEPKWFETAEALAILEKIRVAAALAMGLVEDREQARTKLTNLPLVSIVRPPCDYRARSSEQYAARQMDIVTQMISAGQPHKATPLTGAMCLAASSMIPGTIAHAAAVQAGGGDIVRIGHPSGVLQVAARCDNRDGGWHVTEASVYRTARRLFEGNVLVPA